jgi:hypothetical protein
MESPSIGARSRTRINFNRLFVTVGSSGLAIGVSFAIRYPLFSRPFIAVDSGQ